MPRFRCKRFPQGTRYINTKAGRAVFVDGEAAVDEDDLAAALREVPAAFQISEVGGTPVSQVKPITYAAPGERDNKPTWVDWAVHNGADRAEANAMTKKDLIATFGD